MLARIGHARYYAPITQLCGCGIASNRSATKPNTDKSGASPPAIPHARKNRSIWVRVILDSSELEHDFRFAKLRSIDGKACYGFTGQFLDLVKDRLAPSRILGIDDDRARARDEYSCIAATAF